MKKMPKWMTTVTPLSKTIALIVFTSFPVFAFIFGMQYQTVMMPYTPAYHPAFIVREVNRTDSAESLTNRCGGLDTKALPASSRTLVVNGPAWAPDCRHKAWSVWETTPIVLKTASKPAALATTPKQSDKEGIYVMNDNNGAIRKVYSPGKPGEHPTFLQWVDRSNLIFNADGKKYHFNVISGQIKPE